MQKQFTLIHWMPTHLPFLWCAERVCVCVCIYYLCDCYGWFMFGYICRQATHWKRQRQRQHHFTCVWLKVFAVFNANMQTTMPAKAWKGPELGMISRRQDRTWPTNKRGPDKQQHSDNGIQKYSRACRGKYTYMYMYLNGMQKSSNCVHPVLGHAHFGACPPRM